MYCCVTQVKASIVVIVVVWDSSTTKERLNITPPIRHSFSLCKNAPFFSRLTFVQLSDAFVLHVRELDTRSLVNHFMRVHKVSALISVEILLCSNGAGNKGGFCCKQGTAHML